jgi:hypothetical protein
MSGKSVHSEGNVRARAHQGNWQPQRNRNFRELLSARIEHMLLNGRAKIVETATQLAERLRNSHVMEHASHLTIAVAAWFPSVSCSITRFSDSFVSDDGAKDRRSC